MAEVETASTYDEPLTPEQENVASTDIVEVFQVLDEDLSGDEVGEEIWRWRRVTSEGELVDESENFSGDNFAIAAGSNANPGLMTHVPDVKARVVEVEEA